MATVATITTPCSRNPISEADKCYEDKDTNHAFAGNDHSGTADQVLQIVDMGRILYSVQGFDLLQSIIGEMQGYKRQVTITNLTLFLLLNVFFNSNTSTVLVALTRLSK